MLESEYNKVFVFIVLLFASFNVNNYKYTIPTVVKQYCEPYFIKKEK
jgi:hypothetical protein